MLENQKLDIDPAAATERLRKEIQDTAATKLTALKAACAPVAELANVHTIRDRQLADLDDLVARLTKDYESGDATPIYQEALEILLRPKNGGIDQALEFLQHMATPIRANIEATSRKLAQDKQRAVRTGRNSPASSSPSSTRHSSSNKNSITPPPWKSSAKPPPSPRTHGMRRTASA